MEVFKCMSALLRDCICDLEGRNQQGVRYANSRQI